MRHAGGGAVLIDLRAAPDREVQVGRAGALRVQPQTAFEQEPRVARGVTASQFEIAFRIGARSLLVAEEFEIAAAQLALQLVDVPVGLDLDLSLVPGLDRCGWGRRRAEDCCHSPPNW